MTESMNKRTYIMSLLAMIFLPATFLTGLFGVNLGDPRRPVERRIQCVLRDTGGHRTDDYLVA